jgi:hypothetical protein
VRGNADEAVEIVDFLHGFGVRTFAMNGMIHSGCGVRHPAALGTDELAPILARVIARADALGMRFLWYTPTEHCRLSPIEAGLGIRCCNATCCPASRTTNPPATSCATRGRASGPASCSRRYVTAASAHARADCRASAGTAISSAFAAGAARWRDGSHTPR